MNFFDDYPYSAIREAFSSMLGRLGLVLLSIILASMLAGLTAMGSLGGAVLGPLALPTTLPVSFLFSVGIVVVPFVILFACLFARSEWPLRTVGICVLLMWWNLHGVMRWAIDQQNGPAAKEMRRVEEEIERSLQNTATSQPATANRR